MVTERSSSRKEYPMPVEHQAPIHDRQALAGDRRRFLMILGGGLFGLAGRVFVPAGTSAAPTPTYCHGAIGCDTCNGSACTQCHNGRSYDCNGVSGRTCWRAVGGNAGGGCKYEYRCCDWFRSNWEVCICRSRVGIVCPSAVPRSRERRQARGNASPERASAKRNRRG